MTYFAYLDEFGHIDPYLSSRDRRYKDSSVFGLAGFVLASEVVRGFGTWFFPRKCELLEFEIRRSGKHPALWEKKGASLYAVTNVTRYAELRRITNRLVNKIEALGGFVFFFGLKKTRSRGRTIRTGSTHRYFLTRSRGLTDSAKRQNDGSSHPQQDCRLHPRHRSQPRVVFAYNTEPSGALTRRQKK